MTTDADRSNSPRLRGLLSCGARNAADARNLGSIGSTAKGRYLLTVVVAGIAVVFSALVTISLMELGGQPYSAFPMWWTATATAFAFAAASVAAAMAYAMAEREVARDERRREDERRFQANRVAAWASQLTWLSAAAIDGQMRKSAIAPNEVLASNVSGLPVTNVTIAFDIISRLPGRQFTDQVGTFQVDVLPPSEGLHQITLPEDIRRRIAELANARERDGFDTEQIILTAGVAFTDVAQLHWIRQPNGDLREAPEELWRLRQSTRI